MDKMKPQDILQEVDPNTIEGGFSKNLVQCRSYLLEMLKHYKTDFDTIYILGSWYGNLSLMFATDSDFTFDKIVNVETNIKCLLTGQKIADKLGYTNIEPMRKDANELDYRQLGKNGLVINYSPHNIIGSDWFNNIPDETMVVIQGRNNDNGSVKKYNSLDNMRSNFRFAQLLYSGERTFTDPETKYNCYLLIGIK
jgi:hypothetical protein